MVQAYCDDGSSKSLVAASDCSVFWLRQQLVGKCRAAPSLAWTLVEQLPSLHLERELEEDEKISDILEAWERPNDNRLLFSSRICSVGPKSIWPPWTVAQSTPAGHCYSRNSS